METEIRDNILEDVQNQLANKRSQVGEQAFKMIQKQVLLQVVDHCWSGHLSTLDHLRSVIGFRGYAQRDPLNEYKQEAFILFESLLEKIKRETIKVVFFAKFIADSGSQPVSGLETDSGRKDGVTGPNERMVFTEKKIRRNSPVPAVLEKNLNTVMVQFRGGWKKSVVVGEC